MDSADTVIDAWTTVSRSVGCEGSLAEIPHLLQPGHVQVSERVLNVLLARVESQSSIPVQASRLFAGEFGLMEAIGRASGSDWTQVETKHILANGRRVPLLAVS